VGTSSVAPGIHTTTGALAKMNIYEYFQIICLCINCQYAVCHCSHDAESINDKKQLGKKGDTFNIFMLHYCGKYR
jgi:hypothetical protein